MSSLDRTPIHVTEHERIALRTHTALYEIANGTARNEEWRDLADAINSVEALVFMHKLKTISMNQVNDAIEGMVEALDCDEGRMRMHAGQIASLRRVVCAYDEALGRLSRATMAECHTRVVLKIASHKTSTDGSVQVYAA